MRASLVLALALIGWSACFPAAAETLVLKPSEVVVALDANSQEPVLNIRLVEDSAAAFGAFTVIRVGERINVRVGEKLLTSPIIQEAILSGTMQISGNFTLAEAEALATLLRSGAALIEVDGKDK